MEQPDGIVITISQKMLKERGYKNWLKNFLDAMGREDWIYSMRQGACPKKDVLYVYLCIGGRVRFRALFVGTSSGTKKFSDGKVMTARAWIEMSGPVVRPPHDIEMKGFRGFRYTEMLF